jgi:hypothetical protein
MWIHYQQMQHMKSAAESWRLSITRMNSGKGISMQMKDYKPSDEELTHIANRLLAKSADWMAYESGGREQFYYIIDAQRLAMAFLQKATSIPFVGLPKS